MSAGTPTKQAVKLVVEICPPGRPFCPWVKKLPMGEGIRYVHIDVGSLPTRHLAGTRTTMPHHHGRNWQQHNPALLPSLNDATVSEFYISSNPYLSGQVMPALVREARQVLESAGNLVFFNGYIPAIGGIVVDFEHGCAGTRNPKPPPMVFPHNEMTVLFQDFFRPLTLQEHIKFLTERGLGNATELEPGVNVSVLVKK